MKNKMQSTLLIVVSPALFALLWYVLYRFYDSYLMDYIYSNWQLFDHNVKIVVFMCSAFMSLSLLFGFALFVDHRNTKVQKMSFARRFEIYSLASMTVLFYYAKIIAFESVIIWLIGQELILAGKFFIAHIVLYAIVFIILAIINMTAKEEPTKSQQVFAAYSLLFFLSLVLYPFLHGRL
jgi:hypothetical protein